MNAKSTEKKPHEEQFQDYRKGIGCLKYYLYSHSDKNLYVQLMSSHWIFKFSKILSKHCACYNFWHDYIRHHEEEKKNIFSIKLFNDLSCCKCTFAWTYSILGYDYWAEIIPKVINELRNQYGSLCHLK